jgi:hypothetical protein
MIARIALLSLALLPLAQLTAQTSESWAKLSDSSVISAGSDVRIKTIDNKTHRGRFKAAEADALIAATGNGEERFARDMISRVLVKKKGRRGWHTLMGFGIGAAAGLTLGAVVDARCTGKCIEGNHAYGKELGTGLGALIGTIIGAALPAGGWREVYRGP